MAGSAEELVSRKISASSNLSDLDRRGSSPSIYDLNEALTLDDLAAVYSCLFEVRSKWFSIGLELGVDATKLTDIERDGSDDGKALRKMLMIILKKQISGRRLCEALREHVVDEAVLAQNLEINLPRSVISRRLQTTNFMTRGTSDTRRSSNTPSSSAVTSSIEVSTGTDPGLTMESRLSPSEPISKGTEGVSNSLPDVVTTGQSQINPKIKRLPSHYNDEECTHCFKVNVVGDPDVGKSTMLLRYMKSSFTFGDRMLGPTLQWETVGVCVFQYNDKRVKLYLWDTAGCEQNFDLIPTRYFTDVHGTIIMFDVSRKQTLVNALSDRGSNRGRKQKSWIKEVDFRAEDDNLPVKILVGGKIDIKEKEVTSEEAEACASRHGLPYLEVSSKENGLGIQEVFYKLIELLMDRFSGRVQQPIARPVAKQHWPTAHDDTDPLIIASSPGPSQRGEKGLVHTDCACASKTRCFRNSQYLW